MLLLKCQPEIRGCDCPVGDMAQNQLSCCQGVMTNRTEGLLLLSTWMIPVPRKSADLRPGFLEISMSRNVKVKRRKSTTAVGSASQKWVAHTELLKESNFKQPQECNLCLWCSPGAPVLSLGGSYQAGPRTKCAAFPSRITQGLLVCFSPAVPTHPYQTLSFQQPPSPANALISFPVPALSTGGEQPGSLIPQLPCSLAV